MFLLVATQSSFAEASNSLVGCGTVTAGNGVGVSVIGKAWRVFSKAPNQKSLSFINGPPRVNPPSFLWKGVRRQPSSFTSTPPEKSLSGQLPSPGLAVSNKLTL